MVCQMTGYPIRPGNQMYILKKLYSTQICCPMQLVVNPAAWDGMMTLPWHRSLLMRQNIIGGRIVRGKPKLN